MAIFTTSRSLLTALFFSAACLAQTSPTQSTPPPPCPDPNQTQTQTTKPCPPPAPDAKKPSTAEQFPFPGAPSKSAPPPYSPSPTATPKSAAEEHPFPTEPAPRLPGEDSSSSSSGSGSAADPDVPDTDLPKPGEEGSSVHRKLPKVKRVQTDDERVDEDLKVARFYMRDDNLPGAYLRAKDAVKVQPEYSETHFALAEVAQKMKKKEEAVAEYQQYLKLDPEGEKAKAAQRALDELH
jgi:hypothetical protein